MAVETIRIVYDVDTSELEKIAAAFKKNESAAAKSSKAVIDQSKKTQAALDAEAAKVEQVRLREALAAEKLAAKEIKARQVAEQAAIKSTQREATEKIKAQNKYESEYDKATAASAKRRETIIKRLRQLQLEERKNAEALAKEIRVQAEKSQKELAKIGAAGQKTANILGGIRNAVVAAFAFSELKALTADIIKVTAEFQKFQAVLTNTLGSRTRALIALEQIQNFAATTPFQVDELTNSFVKLANNGINLTVGQMAKIGDTAAALGKPFEQVMEGILDINNTERWAEIGIKAKTAGDKVSLTFKRVTKEVERSQAGVLSAIEAFGQMEGVSGSMGAIAQTLEGQLSNLSDSANLLKNDIGNELSPALSGFIGLMAKTISKGRELIKWFRDVRENARQNTGTIKLLITVFAVLGGILTALAVRFALLTVRTIAYAAATRGAALTQRAFNAVLNTSSGLIGLVIASLSAAAVVVTTYANAMRIATDATTKFNEATRDAKDGAAVALTQIGALADQLNATTADSERRDIIAQINNLLTDQITDQATLTRLLLSEKSSAEDVKNLREDANNALLKQTVIAQNNERLAQAQAQATENQRKLEKTLGAEKTAQLNQGLKQLAVLKQQVDANENNAQNLKTSQDRLTDINTQIERGRVGIGYGNTLEELKALAAQEKERIDRLKEAQKVIDTPASKAQRESAIKQYNELRQQVVGLGASVVDVFRFLAGESAIGKIKELIDLRENLAENGQVFAAATADVLTYDRNLKASTMADKGKIKSIEGITIALKANVDAILENIVALEKQRQEVIRAAGDRQLEFNLEINRLDSGPNRTNTEADIAEEEVKTAQEIARRGFEAERLAAREQSNQLQLDARQRLKEDELAERQKINERIAEVKKMEKVDEGERSAELAKLRAQRLELEQKYQKERDFIVWTSQQEMLQADETFRQKQLDLDTEFGQKMLVVETARRMKQLDAILASQEEVTAALNQLSIASFSDSRNPLANQTVGIEKNLAERVRVIANSATAEGEAWRQLFTEQEIQFEEAALLATGRLGKYLQGRRNIEIQANNQLLQARRDYFTELERIEKERFDKYIVEYEYNQKRIFELSRVAANDAVKIAEFANAKINNPNLSQVEQLAGRTSSAILAATQEIINATAAQAEFFLSFDKTIQGQRLQNEIDTGNLILAEKNRVLLAEKAIYEEKKKLYGADSAEAKAAAVAVIQSEDEVAQQTDRNVEKQAEQTAATKKYKKEQAQAFINLGQTVVNTVGGAINTALQNEIDLLDQNIVKQNERIDTVRKALQEGGDAAKNYSADQLEVEEQRLRKLQELREADVRKQQTLALIQMVLNAGIAITKAAAEGGGLLSAVTIGITLASLAAGLVAARSQATAAAQTPTAEKGGVVSGGKLLPLKGGGGVLRGKRHTAGGILIEAEDGEAILPRNQFGQYLEFVQSHYDTAKTLRNQSYLTGPTVSETGVQAADRRAQKLELDLKGLRQDVQQLAKAMQNQSVSSTSKISGRDLEQTVAMESRKRQAQRNKGLHR